MSDQKERALNDLSRILSKIRPYIEQAREIDRIGDIESGLTFTCNACGKCCDEAHDATIMVSFSDMNNWLDRGAAFIFPTIILLAEESMPYFKIMSRYDAHLMNLLAFLATEHPDLYDAILEQQVADGDYSMHFHITNNTREFSSTFIQTLENINPSLHFAMESSKIREKARSGNLADLISLDIPDESFCIFYNTQSRACSIHENRPLTCKLYPFVCTSDALKKTYARLENESQDEMDAGEVEMILSNIAKYEAGDLSLDEEIDVTHLISFFRMETEPALLCDPACITGGKPAHASRVAKWMIEQVSESVAIARFANEFIKKRKVTGSLLVRFTPRDHERFLDFFTSINDRCIRLGMLPSWQR